ncbi:AsmA family protein [Desulfocastanea catecholica]
MSKPLKIILLVASGIVVFLVFVWVTLLLFVNTGAYKPRLEAAASRALGMDVRVGGRLGIDLFPDVHFTLEDVHIGNQGADVASVKEARVGIDLRPLLQREIRIGTIKLKHPIISIERDRDGYFNFQKPEDADVRVLAFGLSKFSLSEGTLLFADKQSGEGFEALNCSLKIDHLRLPGGKISGLMKNLSLTVNLACGKIRKNGFTVSDLKLSAAGKNGVFDFKPVTMGVFGAQGSGSIRADFSDVAPRFDVRYALPQFRIEEFFKTLSPQKVAVGSMDFSANLSMHGKTVNKMRQTAEGQILLRGKNLTLNGRDLDQELSRFESSQHFNLVDVGAFFFAGPLGLVVTKGLDFVSIFQGSGGRSEIRTLVSDWKVERGVAQAQDVAMATNENRVALQGGLDFVNEQFNDVTVALLDAEGCAKVEQSIRGAFQKPVVEQPSVLKSLTGPVQKLFNMGRDLFPGGECEVFYTGSVAPPK